MQTENTAHFLIDGTECPLGAGCILASVHSRLQEAHRHWHHCLDNYADPEAFRSYLNSCIQALRNITFVLQQKKSLILGFDEFYSPWQEQLRADPVLRWVVEARNRIVKQGDLETKSIARTSIIVDYGDPPSVDIEVPPLLRTEEIAHRILNLGDQEGVASIDQDAVFRLERRWVDQSLPDWELLDAMGHAYTVLACLVREAHRPANTHDETPAEENATDRLECMVTTDEDRMFLVKVATGEALSCRERPAKLVPAQRAIEHFGELPPWPAKSPNSKTTTLRELCTYFFSLARQVMTKDGYHVSMAILFTPSGPGKHIQFALNDRSDKLIFWSKLAREVEKIKADKVIVISEAWQALFDPAHPTRTATASPDREEVLALTGVSASSEEISLFCRILRTSDGCVLSETVEMNGLNSFFLEPIKRSWATLKHRQVKRPKRAKWRAKHDKKGKQDNE